MNSRSPATTRSWNPMILTADAHCEVRYVVSWRRISATGGSSSLIRTQPRGGSMHRSRQPGRNSSFIKVPATALPSHSEPRSLRPGLDGFHQTDFDFHRAETRITRLSLISSNPVVISSRYFFLCLLAFCRLRYLCFDIFLRRFLISEPNSNLKLIWQNNGRGTHPTAAEGIGSRIGAEIASRSSCRLRIRGERLHLESHRS